MFDLINPALAQDANSIATHQAVEVAYTWICANKSIVEPVLEWFIGTWVVTHLVSIPLKKLGVTKDTP